MYSKNHPKSAIHKQFSIMALVIRFRRKPSFFIVHYYYALSTYVVMCNIIVNLREKWTVTDFL